MKKDMTKKRIGAFCGKCSCIKVPNQERVQVNIECLLTEGWLVWVPKVVSQHQCSHARGNVFSTVSQYHTHAQHSERGTCMISDRILLLHNGPLF